MSGLRKRSTGWLQVSNSLAENPDLTFRARGILIYLLAKPDGWDVRSEAIAKDGKEGRDAVRKALRELAEHGYYRIVRKSVRAENGSNRWVTETEVSAEPVAEWIAEHGASPEPGNPSSETAAPAPGNPAPGNPASGESAATSSATQTKDSDSTPALASLDAADDVVEGQVETSEQAARRLVTAWMDRVKNMTRQPILKSSQAYNALVKNYVTPALVAGYTENQIKHAFDLGGVGEVWPSDAQFRRRLLQAAGAGAVTAEVALTDRSSHNARFLADRRAARAEGTA